MKKWVMLAMVGAVLCDVYAERVRPTVAGVLQSVKGGEVVIRNDAGTLWRARLEPNAVVKWMGSNRTLSSIPTGSKVMLRVTGSMVDKPLKVDLVTDWGSSAQYVATSAPTPYYTKTGEFAGPTGVGGRPDNAPNPGKDKKVGAYAIHGGMPHQNPQEIPNILAPRQQSTGVANVPKGVPGFQPGLTAPPADPNPPLTPSNSAANYPPPAESLPPEAAAQNSMNPGVQPGMYPGMQPGTYPGMQPGTYPGMQPGTYPGMQPGMYPGMQPGMQPGMPPGMQPGMMNPQTTSLDSLLNGGDETGYSQGGPMFPGMGGMAGMGTPVQMQATVLRSDPMTRSLVVQAVGTQMPQHITLGPQVMLPPLREGQMVMINGSSNPQGIIEAQQVTPFGH